MADESAEKTEEPTSKKIADAKKEGNVPKSIDVAGFMALFAAVIALFVSLKFLADTIANLFVKSFTSFSDPMTQDDLAALGLVTILEVLKVVIPIATIVGVFGAIGYLMQFGFIFTTKPLQPDIKKIDPIKGTKNLFSMQKFIDGFKITLKVTIAMSITGWFLWKYAKELVTVHLFNFGDQLAWLYDKALVLVLVMLLIFFVFAIADVIIVRYFHFKKLRMSKQEIRDEFKNTEGNPEIKARIRRIQMEQSRNRMMADIPTADVVITNPTHFAVALRFAEKDPAPMVVAKGADLLALKIREIAIEHKIQIVENPALARELYSSVDVGRVIPEKLYHAVSEVFNFVYQTQGRDIQEILRKRMNNEQR